MKFGILNEFLNEHEYYMRACEDLGVDYEVIDVIGHDWLDKIKNGGYDGILVRPSCKSDIATRMYVEKLFIINDLMGIPIYPSLDECTIYENKRMMAYWLEANDIPYPKTRVFYSRDDAMTFLEDHETFPLIYKPNAGSGAIGIKPVNRKQAINLVKRVFTRYLFFNQGLMKWYKTKYGVKLPVMDDRQYNNILFQDFVDIRHEWRGVRIGDSYFAHIKLPGEDGLRSGSGKADYRTPPQEVMDFIHHVCEKGKFRSMNVDFFEDSSGNFFVNELQTVFGSKIQPYQMMVDGKPGRYLRLDGKWIFQEGDFNRNSSYNLRVEDFMQQLKLQ